MGGISLIGSVLLLAVTGQQAAPASLEARARAAFVAELKDPLAAQFLDLREVPIGASGNTVICGLVNAKNSYGAYVGFKPFTIHSDGNVFLPDDSGDKKKAQLVRGVISALCKPKEGGAP